MTVIFPLLIQTGIRAIKSLDYLCSDEGQVLTHWGIEGVNYEIDENGHRYRPQEEIDYSNTDTEYKRVAGVGFHTYPFPTYGDGIVDSTENNTSLLCNLGICKTKRVRRNRSAS